MRTVMNTTIYRYRPIRFSEDFIQAIPGEALHILHLGSGDGQQLAALRTADSHRRLYGADKDAECCQQAAACLDQVFHVDIQHENPPLKRGSMDCLLIENLLERLESPEEMLQRMSELLKPAGCIVAQVTCSQFGPSASYWWQCRENAQSVCKVIRRFSFNCLETLFAQSGMCIEVLNRTSVAYSESKQLILRARFSEQIIY